MSVALLERDWVHKRIDANVFIGEPARIGPEDFTTESFFPTNHQFYNDCVSGLSASGYLIEVARHAAPTLRRGIVAERAYSQPEWNKLPRARKQNMAWLLHAPRSRPQFIAYSVRDLPAVAPLVARGLFGLPLLTWTVRSEDDRKRASRWADQIIFEGWRP